LFLEPAFGMGRRMYQPVNQFQAVYRYMPTDMSGDSDFVFESVNQHNNLILIPADLERILSLEGN